MVSRNGKVSGTNGIKSDNNNVINNKNSTKEGAKVRADVNGQPVGDRMRTVSVAVEQNQEETNIVAGGEKSKLETELSLLDPQLVRFMPTYIYGS